MDESHLLLKEHELVRLRAIETTFSDRSARDAAAMRLLPAADRDDDIKVVANGLVGLPLGGSMCRISTYCSFFLIQPSSFILCPTSFIP